jgi:hypothetical protein
MSGTDATCRLKTEEVSSLRASAEEEVCNSSNLLIQEFYENELY